MTQGKPFNRAMVAVITADQGGGKSNTAVARTVTDGINSIQSVLNPKTGETYPASALSSEEKKKLRVLGYHISYDTVRIQKPDKSTIITRIPDGFSIIPSIKIFANFHLFGIQYKYLKSWGAVVEGLDKETIEDGRLELDEYYIGAAARDGMTNLGKALAKYNFQMRKRHLYVDILTPLQRLTDWTSRVVVTERISCTFDENTRMITVESRIKNQTKVFSYYAPLYWKYFNTDEKFKLPTGQVDRAVAQGV